MSPRIRRSIVGAVLAGLGGPLILFAPPAAVALTFAGAYVAMRGQAGLNVPWTRAIALTATLVHGVIVALASHEPFLGAAAAAGLLPAPLLNEPVVRRFGYHSGFLAPLAVPVLFACTAAAWPFGWWGLAVVPSLAQATRFAIDVIGQMRRRRSFNRPQWGLKVGETVPDFHLPARDGRAEFRLSEHRGRFVLLFFVRSDWCPVCHVQLRVFQKEAGKLARSNVELVAVGTASGREAVELSTLMGVEYRFLVDEGCRVAAMFDAVQPNLPEGQQVPLPATFLIDPEGILRHTSRPDDIGEFVDPGRILSVLDDEHAKRETAPPVHS